MESSMGRRAIGLAIGILTALIIVAVVQAIGHRVYPPPPDININTAEGVRQFIGSMSGAALSFVLAAWFLGALIGGWVALRVSLWRTAPWIVSLVIIAGGMWSFIIIPHPLWMMASGLVLPVLATVLLLRRANPELA